MMKFIKLALIAIFLIIGFVSANAQLDASENAPRPAARSPCLRPRPSSSTSTTSIPAVTEAPAVVIPSTQAPTKAPATASPTTPPPAAGTSRPTNPPPLAPTTRPVSTSAPTQKATSAPTAAPTVAPTQKATSAPTVAPTQKATSAPTQKATSAPTVAPTVAPTQKATVAPTQKATVAPTQKATVAPTVKATSAPTTRPSTTGGPAVDLCAVTPVADEPLQFLVPLYVYPDASWDLVAAGASKVPTVAVVNPANGPTATPSSTYAKGMDKLAAANVEMVGYVYTSYAERPISEVKRDIDVYVATWPHIKGIFFDEGASSARDIPYYKEAYDYVMSKFGYKHVILNPGVQPAQGYLDISTNIVIFESSGDKFDTKASTYSNWVSCAPNAAKKAGYKYKFSGIAHTVTSNADSTAVIRSMEKAGIGMVYITDGAGGCCTYNDLVTYYSSQATDINKINNN